MLAKYVVLNPAKAFVPEKYAVGTSEKAFASEKCVVGNPPTHLYRKTVFAGNSAKRTAKKEAAYSATSFLNHEKQY